MGLISSASKRDKAGVRVMRAFPLVGQRTAMLYFPDSVGGGFACVPVKTLSASRVFVQARRTGEDEVFDVRVQASAQPEVTLLTFQSEAAAKDVVSKVSLAIAPVRGRLLWWGVAALVLLLLFTGSPQQGPQQLSIYKPIAQAARAVPAPAPASAAALTPSAPAAAAPAADKNDPFGLKFQPAGN